MFFILLSLMPLLWPSAPPSNVVCAVWRTFTSRPKTFRALIFSLTVEINSFPGQDRAMEFVKIVECIVERINLKVAIAAKEINGIINGLVRVCAQTSFLARVRFLGAVTFARRFRAGWECAFDMTRMGKPERFERPHKPTGRQESARLL
ncbi:hypothetical protein [Roseobacter sp.]|uniref:hypothetical protein n=1 Tax=Roseobacter sp. TaxID=1907202 RepID=UPI003299EC9A